VCIYQTFQSRERVPQLSSYTIFEEIIHKSLRIVIAFASFDNIMIFINERFLLKVIVSSVTESSS